MDIVEALATQLKLPENAARGLAGQVLGLIEDTVREKVSFGVASRIRDAVPEMVQWQVASPTLRPGSLSLLTLPATRSDQSELQGLLERFCVDVGESERVNALALRFLSTRLDAAVLTVITKALS